MLNFESTLSNQQFIDIALRLGFAFLASIVIGYEREKIHKQAGMRTHILVAMTSCMLMILALIWKDLVPSESTTRIVQGAITGVGFLGAGTIIRDGSKIRGLTTSATIWIVSALGLMIGAGMFYTSIILTIVILIVLQVLAKFENRIIRCNSRYRIHICSNNIEKSVASIVDQLDNMRIKPLNVNINKDVKTMSYVVYLSAKEHRKIYDMLYECEEIYEIKSDILN